MNLKMAIAFLSVNRPWFKNHPKVVYGFMEFVVMVNQLLAGRKYPGLCGKVKCYRYLIWLLLACWQTVTFRLRT